MLSKKNRIDKKTMEILFKNSKVLSFTAFSFRFFFSKDNKTPKIAFICPKSVSKSAIIRNLLRRRGYASIREFMQKIPQNTVGAFIFNKKALDLYGGKRNKQKSPVFLLREDIESVLQKI